MTRLAGEPGGATVSVTRAVAAFLVAGLVVLTATGAVLAVLQRRQAVTEAVRDARSLTSVMAHAVVGPVLSDAALVPGADRKALDELVNERVLGKFIVRVKIWDTKGRIVYSDDTSLIGRVFPLPDEERRLRSARVPSSRDRIAAGRRTGAGRTGFPDRASASPGCLRRPGCRRLRSARPARSLLWDCHGGRDRHRR